MSFSRSCIQLSPRFTTELKNSNCAEEKETDEAQDDNLVKYIDDTNKTKNELKAGYPLLFVGMYEVNEMSLQSLRKKKGYTAKELGAITGVKYRTIQNLECGANDINSLNLASLCKLAIALDCHIKDLLTDEELKIQLKLALKGK